MCQAVVLNSEGEPCGANHLQFAAKTKVCRILDDSGKVVGGCNMDVAPGASDLAIAHTGDVVHRNCAKMYYLQRQKGGTHKPKPAFTMIEKPKPKSNGVVDLTQRFRDLNPEPQAT